MDGTHRRQAAQAQADVEAKLAEIKQKETALLFATGFLTNIGVLPALVRMGQMARAAKACNAGGVGTYSGSNFVHMDCGPVSSWGS